MQRNYGKVMTPGQQTSPQSQATPTAPKTIRCRKRYFGIRPRVNGAAVERRRTRLRQPNGSADGAAGEDDATVLYEPKD